MSGCTRMVMVCCVLAWDNWGHQHHHNWRLENIRGWRGVSWRVWWALGHCIHCEIMCWAGIVNCICDERNTPPSLSAGMVNVMPGQSLSHISVIIDWSVTSKNQMSWIVLNETGKMARSRRLLRIFGEIKSIWFGLSWFPQMHLVDRRQQAPTSFLLSTIINIIVCMKMWT